MMKSSTDVGCEPATLFHCSLVEAQAGLLSEFRGFRD